MTITELVLLGLALSMDAFAVTISNTFIYQGNSRARNILMPIAFGLFQGLMPCIGYVLGRLVSDVISQYAGIITFAILGFIGAKMIWDALHEEAESDEEFAQEGSSDNSVHSGQILTLPVLTLQAIGWCELCGAFRKCSICRGHHSTHHCTNVRNCVGGRKTLW